MSGPEEEPAANPEVQKAVDKETQHHEISKEQLLTSREPSSSIGNSSMGMRRFDSLDIESCKFPAHLFKANWRVVFHLAFQSIGIVFGDIGTSPLYVFPSTFAENRIKHSDDILGVLSLIIYTLTLLPLFKYVFILLHATDNGDGILKS